MIRNPIAKNLFLCLLLIPVGVLLSCRFSNSDPDPGNLTTQIRNVSGYSGIHASAGVDVSLTLGDKEHVEVRAGENIINNVKTEVEGGILHIYYKQNSVNLFGWNHGHSTIKVKVIAKKIESIEASSGSDVVSENEISNDHLKLSSSSGASLNLDIATGELEAEASSGSDSKLRGKATRMTGSSSSGATLKASELHTESSKLEASSGSNISVSVSKALDGHASSGASIRYQGNPSTVSKDKNSGGSIESM